MIRLYYTGSQKFESIQPQPLKSIGGFISSSLVPNGQVGVLFSDISNLSVRTKLSEVKCIAIKNETGSNISNLQVYLTGPRDLFYDIELCTIHPTSITDPQTDEVKYSFEKIPNIRSLPVYCNDFYNTLSFVAQAKVIITRAAVEDESITVLGQQLPIVGTDLNIVETYQFIQSNFSHADYTVQFIEEEVIKINETTGEKYIEYGKYLLFKAKTIGSDSTPIVFTTDGQLQLKESVSFSGGVDNSVSLGSLESDKFLGIWFKRTFNSNPIKVQDDNFDQFYLNFVY